MRRRSAWRKRGCSDDSAPPRAARRRSGSYCRQGAATWRSERRRRGFTTTAAPVAAARALAPGGGRRAVRKEAASPRGPGPAAASRGDRCLELRSDLRGRSVRQALRRTARPVGRQLRQSPARRPRERPLRLSPEAISEAPRTPAGRTGAGPAPRRWWMLGLRGAGRGAGAAAGITEPAEAARRRCTAPQQRGGWRATSRARGSSRSPSRSWPSGPAAVEAPWGNLGGRPALAPARWCCRRG